MDKSKELTEIKPIYTDPHASTFQCPCCHARLQFKLKVNVFGVYELGDADVPVIRRPSKDRLTVEERELVESLKEKGVLTAFEAAVKASPANNAKDIERFLLTFLQRAVPVKTPQFAIRQCLPAGESFGDLELWQLNKVVAVIADGEFRAFFPDDLIKGKPLKSLNGNGGTLRATTEQVDLVTWVKTRHGYVSGRGAFFGEMRKRAAGNFDNTGN